MAMGGGNESFETHLIEEDGTLNGAKFDKFLEKVNLAACGLNYAVVSIMGPQSSGKSTLLNHLFGSNFQELDGFQRRGKTTKGIWMARCGGIEPCTLVMDVEGSDGRERGEDDTTFERQSGLFAFAVSHIVLINMVSSSVGLEHGASKPLLKHVFRGVLRLSTGPRKTTLMFVIRDIIRTTPLKNLDPILRADIKKIWDSIPKPERHKRTPLSTFFNVEVVGLPNYVEREEEFKEEVKILRQRFNHSIAPGGLAGDSRQTILGSDFSFSVQEIWKTIKEDRELDLPKHEVMVANIRCGEIADKMLKDFVANKERRQLEEGAQTNPSTGFGKKYNSIINSYLHGYDKETEYYDEGVRSEKRKQLKEKMMPFVQSALQRILAQIGSRTLKEFEEAFLNAVENRKDVKVAADNCKRACMKSFDDRCADVIVEQANCNIKEGRKELELAIDNVVRQAERIHQAERIRQAEAECIRQAEHIRQAEAERIRQAHVERFHQAEVEQLRQAEAKLRQAVAERLRQAEAERLRQAEAEAERLRQAEAKRLRQAEAERLRQAEAERILREKKEKDKTLAAGVGAAVSAVGMVGSAAAISSVAIPAAAVAGAATAAVAGAAALGTAAGICVELYKSKNRKITK